MKILTANQQILVRSRGGYRAFVERQARERWDAAVNWTVRGVAPAQINRSDWIVQCPFCAGGLVAEPGEPFFCPDCMMQGNDFQAMAVLWPEERAEIEGVLLRRRNPNTRNWLPGETLSQLEAENAAHPGEVT